LWKFTVDGLSTFITQTGLRITKIVLIGYSEILYHAKLLIIILIDKVYVDAKSKNSMFWHNHLYNENRFVAGYIVSSFINTGHDIIWMTEWDS
jgi:hypothetical protein